MRQSPEKSATLFKIGHKEKGIDGNMWIIVETSSGTKRWKKHDIYPKGKKYYTHNNGGRPYLVIISENAAHIYKREIDKNTNKCTYTTLIKKYKIINKYIGKFINKKEYLGNSIILQLSKTKFVFVGHEIYEFFIKDEIKKYYSLVGNSDVPYPVLVGEKNIYFMLDKTSVKHFDKTIDFENAYSLYYGVPKRKKYANGKIKKICDQLSKKFNNHIL
jgi:hypothetical protein